MNRPIVLKSFHVFADVHELVSSFVMLLCGILGAISILVNMRFLCLRCSDMGLHECDTPNYTENAKRKARSVHKVQEYGHELMTI